MTEEEGISGYFIIRDEIIQKIVKGRSPFVPIVRFIDTAGNEGWNAVLPLGTEHSSGGFAKDHHRDALYRPGDGSWQGERIRNNTRCGFSLSTGPRRLMTPGASL
jgi:hypothetical protein